MWMTRHEAADYLKISVTQLNRLKLPRTMLGNKSPRYSRAVLDRYMEEGAVTPPKRRKGGPVRPPSAASFLPVTGIEEQISRQKAELRQMSRRSSRAPRT
jgi:hypothetical protein